MFLNKKSLFFILILVACIFTYSKYGVASKSKKPFVLLSSFTSPSSQKQIQVKLTSTISSGSSPATSVVAAVSLPFDHDGDLKYQWLLTEKVNLKSGKLSGTLSNFKKQKNYEVPIEVIGFSSTENQQIVFRISGTKNGRKMQSDAIIASKKESTFEDIVQNVERIKADEK